MDSRISSLWQQIDEIHFNFINTDESPRKIEEKKRLEACIKDYLSVAPHDQKFFFLETGQVLRQTIERKEDFSVYKAIEAWRAISSYANNLFAQPWRKEFREIKTYCGFYKHRLESCLVGGELMLEVMGYRKVAGYSLVLDGPVDPDRVANVSKDAIIAVVECQILRSIYTDLLKMVGACTWSDVLHYRERFIGSPEQAIHNLSYYSRHHRYPEEYSSVDGYRYPPMMGSCQYVPRYCRYSHEMPYLTPQPHPSHPSACYGVMSPDQHLPPTFPNGYPYRPLNGYPYAPNYKYSMPTSQPMQLESGFHKDKSIAQRRSSSDHIVDSTDWAKKAVSSDKRGRNKEEGWDSWGYVYRGLEGKGYRRDDVSSPSYVESKPTGMVDVDEALKSLSLDDLQLPAHPQTSKKAKDPEECESERLPGGSRQEAHKTNQHNQHNLILKVKLNDKWECNTCTYHNLGNKDVCDMCGKSRYTGNELLPLASGGRECPQCTLVNKKGVTICDACGTNLKDSPTYI